ncbi:MAG: ABC transporter permease [Lachnospiraceae bacterium]|nr:ABC transporter permease [Lachnospiraceae bacterium]
MKNPLNKRLLRELKRDVAKYIVIFLFMILMIGFVSGFMISVESMRVSYVEGFEKLHVEHGNFELAQPIEDALIKHLEDENITVFENHYFEEETVDFDSKLRVYHTRDGIDEVSVIEGVMPKASDEIAIDRMYADNNGLHVGDTLRLGEHTLQITALVALADYTSLYEKPTDMMFDAKKFGVAVMTNEGFDAMESSHLHYVYSWLYDEMPADEAAEKERGEEVLNILAQHAQVTGFIPQYANLGIKMAGEDLGKDGKIVEFFLYIVVMIIAFIFAITTSNTIRQESGVIGTLRASGYSRAEIVIHYLCTPVCVTLVSALIGNILGYTLFKEVAAAMYYGSYSLPKMVTLWNMDAFVKTTVIPVILMFLINFVIIVSKMRFTPLQFIRRDLSSRKNKNGLRLPVKFPVMGRFRLRIILQNLPNYITMVAGIFFANIILLLGLALPAIIYHNQETITDNMLAEYQYLLKAPVPVEAEGAEAFYLTQLKTPEGKLPAESIQIYGIRDDSAYVDIEFPDEGVYVSTAFYEKHGLETGAEITLKEAYGEEEYTFEVAGVYDYPAMLCVFMSEEMYQDVFEAEDGAFNGYFSREALDEIDDTYLAGKITEDDLTKLARQMDVSFGKLIHLITLLGVVMFMLIIFLLSKLIIEKNANCISMCKILGYKDSEIASLYILSTGLVVVVSLIATIPIVNALMETVCVNLLSSFPGWLPYYVPFDTFIKMVVLGIGSYALIIFFQFGSVKKIPLGIALKNVE